MNFLHNKVGQITVVGLLMIFLGIVVLSIMMPSILLQVSYMATNLTTYGYTSEALLVKLIPLFILVALLSSIAIYATTQQ